MDARSNPDNPEDTTTQRDYLLASARKGNRDSQRTLAEAPKFPEAIRYLWEWADEMAGRSGVGMSGIAPLSFTTIRDWSELTGGKPTRAEVEALTRLDAVIRNPQGD
jgi:hypothetical protein